MFKSTAWPAFKRKSLSQPVGQTKSYYGIL